MAELTFYPDTNAAGVDGHARQSESLSWANLIVADGNGHDDTAVLWQVCISTDGATLWDYLSRPIIVIDVSDLPVCTITGVVFSAYGTAKLDDCSISPSLNVYSSNPASPTELANGDYVHTRFGTTAYCDTPITYNAFNIGDPGTINNWVFNATGIAAVQAAADANTVVKLGVRDVVYDVGETLPTHPGSTQNTYMQCHSVDKGEGYKPKLVVTYTADILVTPGTLALSLTTYAPTIAISDHKVVTPSTLALTLTTYAPTVSTPRLVTPSTLALTLTTFTAQTWWPAPTLFGIREVSYGLTTAVIECNIVSTGDNYIYRHGVCWKIIPFVVHSLQESLSLQVPTTSDSKTEEGAGETGEFTSEMTRLDQNTPYYVRGYARNSSTTGYSKAIIIHTGMTNTGFPASYDKRYKIARGEARRGVEHPWEIYDIPEPPYG